MTTRIFFQSSCSYTFWSMSPQVVIMTSDSTSTTEDGSKRIVCVNDLKEAAAQKIPKVLLNFYNDGSFEQITVRENSTAYSKYRIRPRVLTDVSNCDTSTISLGRRTVFPVGIAPAGVQASAHPDGELATSRACAKFGVNMAISSFANFLIKDIRDVGAAINPDMVYAVQTYTLKDREAQAKYLQNAEALGCKAVFLTADSPIPGYKYNDSRDGWTTPEGIGYPNMGWSPAFSAARRADDGTKGGFDEAHNWNQEIPWLRSVTKMEIWIKGILTAEDTLRAVELGCDGIIVSNHGGRQLDSVPAAIDALPECVQAAAGRLKVHIDGGVRTGSDIFKALALGAEFVWIGRPVFWALAWGGEKGVDLLLELLFEEFKKCMKLAGCRSVKDISRNSLGVVRHDGPLARL